MQDVVHPAISAALAQVSPEVRRRSGSVFYSGQSAFSAPAPLYLLGLNPGGNADRQVAETVAVDIEQFQTERAD